MKYLDKVLQNLDWIEIPTYQSTAFQSRAVNRTCLFSGVHVPGTYVTRKVQKYISAPVLTNLISTLSPAQVLLIPVFISVQMAVH